MCFLGENQNYCIIFCNSFLSRGADDQNGDKNEFRAFFNHFKRLLGRKVVCRGKSDKSHHFQFLTLLDQEEPMIKNGWENSAREWWNHFHSISRPKIDSYGESKSNCIILSFGLFLMKKNRSAMVELVMLWMSTYVLDPNKTWDVCNMYVT